MFNLVACEWIKWRRSRMLWLLVIGALLPAALNFAVMLNRYNYDRTTVLHWSSYFGDNLMLMTMLMCPTLFSLLIGYMFAREFQERTVNNLLTGPESRYQVLAAKFIVVIPVMTAVLLLSMLLTWASGYIIPHDSMTLSILGETLGKYGLLLALQFALAPISAAVAILGRSYIPAMGLGVFAVISELTIMQSKYIMYYPWSAPLNLVLNMSPELNKASVGAATMSIAFLLPLLFVLIYFRRADVHSG
ncbi:ABC transporter permease [Paenibacillus solisilvae]|uniref:ABC transporter permease n=1 Tax=Paenibacillus solisilvae TaxID=2486751 RepID=A0ABW0VWX3_9BACL